VKIAHGRIVFHPDICQNGWMKQLILSVLLMSIFSLSLSAEPLVVGDAAPGVKVKNHLGKTVNTGNLYKKGPVVVYFYPRSFTGGCTKQACNIRDNWDDLKKAGVTVLGVSDDPVEKQKEFVDEYSLPFILIGDQDHTLGKAFGVGQSAKGAYSRQTFLVVDGKVAWVDLQANPVSQTEDILKALASLN